MVGVRVALVLCGVALAVACGSSDDGPRGVGGSGSNNAGAGSGSGGSAGSASGNSRCEAGCVDTLAADCDNGPASQQQCVEDCQMLEQGSCASEYDALQDCAEGEAITCNAQGIPIIAACSIEQGALIDCLNP